MYAKKIIYMTVKISSENFLFSVIQTGSEAHPASYPMGTGDLSPGIKRPGCEADH
jgi:hypothetical protein